ncbi:MAG: preprotein translocase subunit SecE [Clostridia bacterium]
MTVVKKARFKGFFKEIGQELKKVVWPTKEQLIKNTVTVIVVCVIVGVIIWLFDMGLSALIRAFVLR